MDEQKTIDMTIHPVRQEADTVRTDTSTPYDSVWAQSTAEPVGLEQVMLKEDKLYVVLTVVLIIWIGIAIFLIRTDRKIRRLERTLEENTGGESGVHE